MNSARFGLFEQMDFGVKEIADRKHLFNLLEVDEKRLAACMPRIQERITGIIESFYSYQMSIPEIACLISEPDTLARLKIAMQQYVLELFTGQYDSAYIIKRLRIGQVHKRLGIAPKLYLSTFSMLHRLLDGALVEDENAPSDLEGCRESLRKLLMFDVELVFDAYIEGLVSDVESSRNEAERYAKALEKKVAELSELSRRDAMTGLLNHRAFIEELRREMARSEREKLTLSLAYIDLNGFKAVNDAHGHQRGDEILKAVAGIFAESTRASDIAFRYGGDEFSIILPNCTITHARQVCTKVVTAMGESQVELVSLSIGIAEASPTALPTMGEFISAADAAMYSAKKLARIDSGNHIVLASDLIQS